MKTVHAHIFLQFAVTHPFFFNKGHGGESSFGKVLNDDMFAVEKNCLVTE